MQEDRRQIQTAVLGSAESEEPLMLPLEAIELDAFRRRHGDDTFWCGLLLGGCGGRLTTKLYTDRVCHFAHHPGPDGLPHLCGRRARGVNSADHLYVKSAAAAWLRGVDYRADFDFARPDGAAIGSVVDIRFQHGGLRVHLDQRIAPVWDEQGHEPVLGMSVPVDQDTLIRRWYVHRIRLDSEGTARRVRIGTEAFARPTEWFALDECAMTERGLSTPAVERIVRSRSTRPVSPWAVGRTRKAPDAQARAQVLLRRLADARRVESVVVVTRVCREIAAVTGLDEETQAGLADIVSDAERWLAGQAEVRRELFSGLEEAVAAGNIEQVRQLLVRANATASHDRTDAETAIAAEASEHLAVFARQRQATAAARLAEREGIEASRAADRVQTLLARLEKGGIDQPLKAMRKVVQDLAYAAVEAHDHLDAHQQEQISSWKARAGIGRRPARAERAARSKRKPPLHEKVGRDRWFKKPCPRCHAAKDKECINDDKVGSGRLRQIPHDERLQLIINGRKNRAEPNTQRPRPRPQPQPSWQVMDVACPDCNAAPGSRCKPRGVHPHQVRVRQFRRRFPAR
ncbi:hypothetical protein [Streptomyces sp. NBC_00892]|uniref:hypothetical protein n=1 Tax=Streptomyces sp. NBC_00892 TaxID=2975861 RepID=UPI002250A54F|nr:hypothetical protein [Streptomyces sp. NBC_00892]MCX4902333.1 hypothetical protein [Streptomyces sp. NBC_00892]